ncbi:hypothetical protein KXQ82_07400 [Mucilaginibacter sp. HMF5004]|uniref:hypothetical protein n=1 Tax=Mucilaginibacter rivuli TaxID=2857527 RepID=UPI001C5E7B63|nr:hypothetical protein [Mucilaginibacter rivuli]MBW4889534.1 hypothetical protein [Mucilaginibacter rivuli]
MDIKEALLFIDGLNFSEIVKRETKEHIDILNYMSVSDSKLFRKRVTDGIKLFYNNEDKMIYLIEALNFFNEQIIELETKINNYQEEPNESLYDVYSYHEKQDHRDRIRRKVLYESQIFYIVRDLEKLGVKNLEKNAFSPQQAKDLTRKIDAILIKIDELTVGQEVLYDFIDELKGDFDELKQEFPLGKKRWYQRATGIVFEFAANKGADVIFEETLKPLIKDLLQNQHIIDRLLK